MDCDEELPLISPEEHMIDEQSQDVAINIEVLEELHDVSPLPDTIHALPEGKDHHLFVSYSSEDAERVWPIVEDIEKRYNLKCIYADRDFQPGMDISQNIRKSFESSWKVLLMLSPNFTHSGWCKYEREFAFVTSMESGLNCIIPVMLEECEVPTTLMTITYIDATQPYCDVPAKVALAMSKSELVSCVLPFDSSKRYENGFMVDIVAKRDPLCFCRPAKYRFTLDQTHKKAIQESKIKLPLMLLKEAVFLINNCRAVQHYDYSSSRLKLCCWSLFLFPLVFIIIMLAVFAEMLELPRTDVVKVYRYGYETTIRNEVPEVMIILLSIIALVIVVPIGLIFIPCICQQQKFYRNVHSKMWNKLARRCLRYNTILLFSAAKNKPPTLYVMRYNISQCQEFLTCLIQAKRENLSESQAKDDAFDLIVEYLSKITPILTTHEHLLPDAPYNRHNVRKGKACICQCLEHEFA